MVVHGMQSYVSGSSCISVKIVYMYLAPSTCYDVSLYIIVCSFYLGHIPDIITLRKQSGTEFLPLYAAAQKWYELNVESISN